jgi:hypothetical protein
MPNYIQYSTSIPSGSLKKGNAALGIADSVAGPTSTNGWYTGINPPTGSYTVYEVAASGDPDIYCPINSTELINLVRSKGATGGNTGSVAAALAWIATQPNLLATNEVYPNIVTSGSIMNLDAGFVGSYPTTGSTWYDISGNNLSGSLVNSPTFNSNGYINFDGADDYIRVNSNILQDSGGTISMIVYPKSTASSSYIFAAFGTNSDRYYITYGTDGRFAVYRGNPIVGMASPVTTINKWYNIVLTWTSSSLSGYLDGNIITSTPYSASGVTSFFTIGAYTSPLGSQAFNGNIASTQIYSRPLSQTEINQNYYQAPIVTNGLVMALDANNIVSYESGSTTTYSLTGSISGSLVNGVGYNNANGGAWVMDGADDFMRVSQLTGSNFPQATGTISFWYYVPSVGGNTDFSDKAIFDGYDTSGRNHFFIRNYYEAPNNIQVVGQLSGSGGAYVFAYNAFLPNDQWHNVVLTYTTGSNSSYQIYMDGTLKNSGTLGANPSTFAPNGQYCGFGSGYLGGGAYAAMQGRYSSLSIYNRALTATEITQNFNAQRNRFNI